MARLALTALYIAAWPIAVAVCIGVLTCSLMIGTVRGKV